MKRYLLISLLVFLPLLAKATISTQVSHKRIQMGDTFRLTFTVDAPQTDSIPDLTPLQQNFSIVGTERSMAYSIINGERHSLNQWIVLLSPQKTGVLLIPAIQIGQEQSTANSIEIIDDAITPSADKKINTHNDQLLLKTEISTSHPFINQQVIYTVKLYTSQRLLDAEYEPPTIEDALLIPLGDGRHYQTILNGRNYGVEDQQYAIFPQKSGELPITPPTFRALIFDNVPKRMTAHTDRAELTVKPIPTNFIGKHWFPAEQAALTEVYDQKTSSLTEGSTLIRTITLQAAGLPAQLLPPIEVKPSDQFNSYPEKPELHNSTRQQTLMGRADLKITYLLNKSGSVTLPAIHVSWFNTQTGKEEILSLPAHRLQVQSSVSSPATSPKKVSKPQLLTPINHLLPLSVEKSNTLAWGLAGGFAFAWVVTLLLWWKRRGAFTRDDHRKAALIALRMACKKNDPHEAQRALLRWASFQWPEIKPLNLHQIVKLVADASLKEQLTLLSTVLYRDETNPHWEGSPLWYCMSRQGPEKSTHQNKKQGLPPINP